MMPDFGVAKPQSGKAVGSLICAGVGLVGGVLCGVLGIAVLVGIVLGALAIAETGPNGSRTGRGLAITGTVINVVLLLGAVAAGFAWYHYVSQQSRQNLEVDAAQLREDFELIRSRLKTYYERNNQSLAPGGPRLAEHGKPGISNGAPGEALGVVQGALKINDLVWDGELNEYAGNFELTVTGSASCTVRFTAYDGRSHSMKVYDIGKNHYSIIQE
ncbi:MAG: hypothetical protein HPKKFMNG_00054 [Planctomycetes bacterium]|nr:hypothetical protein [Planctomycetota bacterium]